MPGAPLPGDPSDRRLPDQEDRPPATRLITPRGAALRVFLTALFEAQTRIRPGQQPGNKRPLASRASGKISWIDLLASDATPSGTGKYHMSASAKKTRQMESAIDRLSQGRTRRTHPHGETRHREVRGIPPDARRRQPTERLQRALPRPRRASEPAFPVPVALFTNGWIHVLEDTELSFILMMANCHHTSGGREFLVTAEDRLLRFGMAHDAYKAHMMLSRLGLVTVAPDPRRRADGTVEDFDSEGSAFPHKFGFTPAGFDRDAFATLTTEIDRELGRAP